MRKDSPTLNFVRYIPFLSGLDPIRVGERRFTAHNRARGGDGASPDRSRASARWRRGRGATGATQQSPPPSAASRRSARDCASRRVRRRGRSSRRCRSHSRSTSAYPRSSPCRRGARQRNRQRRSGDDGDDIRGERDRQLGNGEAAEQRPYERLENQQEERVPVVGRDERRREQRAPEHDGLDRAIRGPDRGASKAHPAIERFAWHVILQGCVGWGCWERRF